MAVEPVAGQPALVFSGEGHVRAASLSDAAAVVLGHEAGNLLNFDAIATARGGYATDQQLYVTLGFVDGQLTVVGGHSSAVIVAPPAGVIPQGSSTASTAAPAQTAGAPQTNAVQTNVELASATGATAAAPVETSISPAPTVPAPPVEDSATGYTATDVSANLLLSPSLTSNSASNEVALANTREALAIADVQNEPQAGNLFTNNIFVERANFQYEPFAGLGTDPLKPFAPTEIPRLFVDGAY